MKSRNILTFVRWVTAVLLLSVSISNLLGRHSQDSKMNESYLNNPNGIVVDGEGNIYCGINYSRINVYDRKSNYVRTINVESDGGDFKMAIEGNLLKVATVRNRMLFVFDKDSGKLISQESRKDNDNGFGQLSSYQYITKEGTIYKIVTPIILQPYLEVRKPNGETAKYFYTPVSKWLTMSPYPSWYFGFFGLSLLALDFDSVIKWLKVKSVR